MPKNQRGFICLSLIFLIVTSVVHAQEARTSFVGGEQPLTAPSSRAAKEIARDYLVSADNQMSISALDLDGLTLAKEYKTEHNGVTHLVYRQQFQGIEVFNAEWVTNVDRDGSIVSAGGTLFGAPPPIVLPDSNSSMRAVRAAVAEVNPRLASVYAPFISSRPARHANAVAYAAGDFGGDIEGRLVWYAVRGTLQLAWVMTVIDDDGVSSYDVAVEEASGAVIGKQALTAFFQFVPPSPNGLIYDKGSPQPTQPGVAATAPPSIVERNLVHLAGDPVASPLGWVANNETAGNNAIVGENRLGLGLIRPVTTAAPNGDFRFPLLLGPGAPAPLLFTDAVNVNLFYWVNRAHDLHYQFGFDEAAGNYQAENFGRGGVGGDAVYAYTHYGAGATVGPALQNAFFGPITDDGGQAQLAMYVGYSSAGGFFTDSALDASVIVHEYTHGVSGRLVRLGYTTFQGRSMGEAWSDFFALEYLVPDGAPTDGVYPEGEYYFNLFGAGLRSHPFSTRTDVNPLTYANLGAVTTSGPEVHADGEIWVEALVEARANLIQQFGEYEGRRRIRFLVLDGMKLSVPAPSMVDMRDAILLADRVDYGGASQSQLWAAFAKRGLGTLAYSISGDSVHVIPSFELPSPTGRMKFFDDPLVAGESVRVVLADSNYSQPTARIQLTGSSGDIEDLVVRRVGSVYFGTLPSSRNVVFKQNGTLNLVPGDSISASYVDSDPGPDAASLIKTTVGSQPPYSLSSFAPSFSFANELRITSTRAPVIFNLPFDFPFFSKTYRGVTIYPTGAVGFGFSAFTNLFTGGCNDNTELARLPAVAPLFANLRFGTAQPNEGIYVSFPGPHSMTIRWAAETFTPFATGDPVNFAVALTDDGAIQYFYGAGNASFTATANGAACGQSPVIGISNGHDVFTQTVLLSTLTNGLSLRYDPPFNFTSSPVGKVERPAQAETVRGVLTVSGIAYDSDASISRVDVFIDGVERAVTGATVSRPDFCAQQNVHNCPLVGYLTNLDVAALGLTPGAHQLRVRVTNTRGSFTDLPDTPTFIVDPAPGRLPKGAIESPVSGATLSGLVQFRGYAYFDDLIVRRVDLLIDGLTYPSASYGLSRTDICNAIPAPKPPNCNNVGWTVTIDTRIGIPPFPDGAHSMQLRVQDETGRFTFLPDTPVPITVKNGAQTFPVGALTSQKSNDRLSGTVTISGYAFSPAGFITSVFVLLDGNAVALASYGDPRPDDCAKLTGVTACPNIGFSATFDTKTVPNGPHVLGVFIRNDRGLSIITPQSDSDGLNVLVDNP
jgi:hypothetical protein